MKQATQFQDKPLKPLTKRILIGVAIIFAILFLAPVALLTSISEGCDTKLENLEKQAADANKKLLQSEKFGPEPGVAYVSGDCTTASGVSLRLERANTYKGAYDAIAQINNEFGSAGLPMHINALDKPDKLYGDVNKNEGGSLELLRVQLDYSVKYGAYKYEIYPAEKVGCTFDSSVGYLCEGVPKDQKVQEILNTREVNRVNFEGYYRKNP